MKYTRYAPVMPNQPKTPVHSLRIPDERWDAIGERAKAAGSDRTTIINALIAWYLREKGASKPPKRPNVGEQPTEGEPATVSAGE